MPDEIEVNDENVAVYTEQIVGRTIVSFERELDDGLSFPQNDNAVTIKLDDGATLRFEGWGYDSCGLITYYTPERSTTDD